jgi:hypothetical protein
VEQAIADVDPHLIVCCGAQAEKAVVPRWKGERTIVVPHPACRVLTNSLYLLAADYIKQPRFYVAGGWHHERNFVRLRQQNGSIETSYQ